LRNAQDAFYYSENPLALYIKEEGNGKKEMGAEQKLCCNIL
jgi:hypothetical protein